MKNGHFCIWNRNLSVLHKGFKNDRCGVKAVAYGRYCIALAAKGIRAMLGKNSFFELSG